MGKDTKRGIESQKKREPTGKDELSEVYEAASAKMKKNIKEKEVIFYAMLKTLVKRENLVEFKDRVTVLSNHIIDFFVKKEIVDILCYKRDIITRLIQDFNDNDLGINIKCSEASKEALLVKLEAEKKALLGKKAVFIAYMKGIIKGKKKADMICSVMESLFEAKVNHALHDIVDKMTKNVVNIIQDMIEWCFIKQSKRVIDSCVRY